MATESKPKKAKPNNTSRVLHIDYKKPGSNESDVHIFDVRKHEGREAMIRFVSWAINNNVEFAARPVEL